MRLAVASLTEKKKMTDEENQVEDSHFDKLFMKSAKRLKSMKHIEAKTLAIDYLFPLLQALRTDLAEEFENVFEMGNEEYFSDDLMDALYGSPEIVQEIMQFIILSGAFIDLILEKTGLQTVNPEKKTRDFKPDTDPKVIQMYQAVASGMIDITTKLKSIEDYMENVDDDYDLDDDNLDNSESKVIALPDVKSSNGVSDQEITNTEDIAEDGQTEEKAPAPVLDGDDKPEESTEVQV